MAITDGVWAGQADWGADRTTAFYILAIICLSRSQKLTGKKIEAFQMPIHKWLQARIELAWHS
jgi:hypothetical protein